MEDLEELRRDAPLKFIAGRIKRARGGLSHDQLHALCGIHRPNLIGFEKGKHRPTLATILRIADATGREPRWFIDPEVDVSPFQAGEKAA